MIACSVCFPAFTMHLWNANFCLGNLQSDLIWLWDNGVCSMYWSMGEIMNEVRSSQS